MNKTIYILHDRRYDTAISHLESNLREIFRDSIDIQYVSKSDLNNNRIWSPESNFLFITPPIMGEKCHYGELYTPNISQKRLDYVKNGGATLDLCAGAYHAFPYIEWVSPTNGKKISKATNSKLFGGTSYGPLQGLGKPSDPENRYSDCIVTPVETLLNNEQVELCCYYGNGCSFTLEDPEIQTLALYAHDQESRPAIVRKTIGKGFSTASGILPHYPYQEQTVPALRELNEQIKPHELSRQKLMHAILGDFARHGISLGTITEDDLVIPSHKLPQITPINTSQTHKIALG